MKVAVISGGRSSEHDVSLRSGQSVASGVEAAGHEVIEVVIGRDGRWSAGDEPVRLTPGEGLLGADAAFPVMHGPYGEDGTIQGQLEVLDIPYVGPGVLAAAVTIDKVIFKRMLAGAGYPQVGFCQAGEPDWEQKAEALGLPLWVKPSRLGSSVGIAKVTSSGELQTAVEAAARHDPRVIIEAHCEGREIEVSLLGNDEVETSVCGEIVIDSDWYDFESKYTAGGMSLAAPADIPADASDQIRAMAVEVYKLAGCSGLARCDFFLTESGEVLVNEINTIPGFTDQSVYARLFEATGLSYPDLCDRLLALAIERHRRERSYEF